MSLLKNFHGNEEGMETIQAVMLLAAAAVVIAGLAWVWGESKTALKKTVKSYVTAPF